MKKQGYMAYGLVILMLATLFVSIAGTVNVLHATDKLSKVSSILAEMQEKKIAEPTVTNARIKMFVPNTGVRNNEQK